jgi:hypothetical protein
MVDLLTHFLTFLAGLGGGLLPHVQKPLTAYRKALNDISADIIANSPLIYNIKWNGWPTIDQDKESNENLMKCYKKLRLLHAQLLSSSGSIPRFARLPLRLLGLLRSPEEIAEGARMLIGISNQVISPNKDVQHLDELVKKLGTSLDINVGDN